MNNILKTTIAIALGATWLAGASFTLAADNSGDTSGGDTTKPRMSDDTTLKTDPSTTGSIKCENSSANVNSGCNKPGHLKQEERMQSE
jgi:hypothetical protein